MKYYPSISKEIRHDIYIYAFDKLDGSNIRAEWNSKKGFYKFGTRNGLMDENTKPWGKAIYLIREKYEEELSKICKENLWSNAICFFEYYGADSFAGTHNFEDKMDISLIDFNPFKQGILRPDSFIKLFGHMDIPKVCYEGYVSTDLFDQVKQSTLPGMTFEGVVCKGVPTDATKMPTMFKIKSKAWLDKLREYCEGDDKLFERLS